MTLFLLGNGPLPKLVFRKRSPKFNKRLAQIANKTVNESYNHKYNDKRSSSKNRDMIYSNNSIQSSLLLYIPNSKYKTIKKQKENKVSQSQNREYSTIPASKLIESQDKPLYEDSGQKIMKENTRYL